MARKSRRNKNVEAVSNQIIENCENLIDTGAYIRLSVENGGNETDETLVVQQMLVEKFIEEHPDLKLAGTYIDNGFSGTNFERPGFLKLMEDVRSGKIQCIVVKDLSRFGRDYLETGYYLETILPRLNVRFIAITDDYDSSRKEDRENISVPLKNMVNAMYAKDMSKKILAAKDAQRKKGNITLSKVAFGYVRSEDRHRQIVDEEVAPFVRMIFQWYMMGVSKKKIADRLNLMGIATPGQREKTGVLTVPLEQTKWRTDTVDKIVNNPTYAGDIVTGKLKQSLYKGIKQYRTLPEDWNVQRDMHTPMIARDDYEELQERSNKIKKVTRNWHLKYMEDREKYKDCFPGMVRCGDCGRPMYCVRYTHNYKTMEKVGIYYTCSAQNYANNYCGQKIEENLLKILVMDQIQILIRSMCDRKKLLQKLKSDSSEKNAFYEAEIIEEFKDTAEQICSMIPAPDLVLLDWNLPGESGFDICTKLKEHSDIPIIFLTSRTDSMDELTGILKGADDYITKPFNPPILLARIGVVLKRTTDKNAEKSRGNALNVEYKGVILNVVGGCIEHEGKKTDLTKNELKILHLLYQKKGEIVPRLDMIEYLWDNEVFIDDNTLSVNVTRLRGKLADIGVTDFIETKRGMGYRI